MCFVFALATVCAVSAESTTDELLPSDTCSALKPDQLALFEDIEFYRDVNEVLLLALTFHDPVCLMFVCVVLVVVTVLGTLVLVLRAQNITLRAQNITLRAQNMTAGALSRTAPAA